MTEKKDKRPAGDRIKSIIKILRAEYPAPKTALNFRTPFQLLVATILSAQCTDDRVNRVTKSLFTRYKNPADFSKVNREDLEKEIRSTGFYRNKAKNIKAASERIMKEFGGSVPRDMDDMLSLPGVARKTANIVLSSAYGKVEGIAVDTHVKRLSRRLGLSDEENAEKIEKDLMELVPLGDWSDFSYLLMGHGREVCMARRPKCLECVINDLCPSAAQSLQS